MKTVFVVPMTWQCLYVEQGLVSDPISSMNHFQTDIWK